MTADDIPDRTVPGVEPYDGPAGGWGALKAVAQAVRDQMGASTDTRALLKVNQTTGHDRPGRASPDPHKPQSFQSWYNRPQDRNLAPTPTPPAPAQPQPLGRQHQRTSISPHLGPLHHTPNT